MLDSVTKRRIDTARDILVGKVPDPKSQVEQITIALIYKFMDDMDAESEELGGKRKFFAGEFAKYGWSQLMSPRLGGHEMLGLYGEGIARMPQNPGVPPLFRDIFKNAYLPYRDPETLKAFLKIIGEFSYDHSERLGDAFEYLLSVLGSQGDAGQFRTPRHIIDWIVEVVAPKKGEVILDPACGTGGFLISAYKHIQRTSVGAKGESTLTPDDRARLAKSLKGYDISPDMVRLSLANLYLHGFTVPQVHEYDTLTSEDRWNEHADVILANPPFMSPKGGIRPHKRFSIQAKRSEVLFVDYIAEHLTPTGRAGIIVPEGIIFQNGAAYVALRKLLVEQSLMAVVSLPAGVFNPYSNVKTSILILDKAAAKHSSTIGFFKIENDGFGLGAQRREIIANDLPAVRDELGEYLRRLCARESVEDFAPTLGQIVPKSAVAAKGDYNLSGERYRATAASLHVFPLVPLRYVCTVNPNKREALALEPDTRVSFVPMAALGENRMYFAPPDTKQIQELGSSYTYFAEGDVLVAKVTPCFENGKAGVARSLVNGVGFGSSEFYVLRPSDQVLAEYVYFCVTSTAFRQPAIDQMTGTGGLQRVPKDFVENFLIPLPPLDVQREIVAEIEGYQRVIDGARAVVHNYRPRIVAETSWPLVRLEEICETITDGDHQPPPKSTSGVPFVTIGNIGDDGVLDLSDTFFVSHAYYDALKPTRKPQVGDILFTVTGSYGRPAVVPRGVSFCFQRHIALLRPSPGILSEFLYVLLCSEGVVQQAHAAATGVAQKTVSLGALREFRVPLPTLDTQRDIIGGINEERAIVAATKELVARFERKIQATLARVWGEAAVEAAHDLEEALT